MKSRNSTKVKGKEDEACARVWATQDAMKRSKEIDRRLSEGKKALAKRRDAVKVLLLGQSDSGKSSFLKNFQLAFAPSQIEEERDIWKVVIQLNVIGSIKTIMDALREEYEPNGIPVTMVGSRLLRGVLSRLRRSLAPLFIVEANLLKLLAPGCSDSRTMSVSAGDSWKGLLRHKLNRTLEQRRLQTQIDEEYDLTSILAAQKDEIIASWKDNEVQEILRRRRPHLKESPGFFMDDLSRVATMDYIPTNSDIVKARIKTIGVEEHQFVIHGTAMSPDLYITDVGGTVNQRTSWASFFDDVQVILFLVPLAFNQTLEEDPKKNRLEDSFHLWSHICGNRLLTNAELILLFSKIDVLEATLASGVSVKEYVPSYGDLADDVPTVTNYFKKKFTSRCRELSNRDRTLAVSTIMHPNNEFMKILLEKIRRAICYINLRETALF